MTATPGLPARIIGLAIALLLMAIGVVYGFLQALQVPFIILSAIAIGALFFWAWMYVLGQFAASDAAEPGEGARIWRQFRPALIALALILGVFAILSATIPGFLNIWNGHRKNF